MTSPVIFGAGMPICATAEAGMAIRKGKAMTHKNDSLM
jgi:hypothetical protein